MASFTPGSYALSELTSANFIWASNTIMPSVDPSIVKRFGNQRFTDAMELMGLTKEVDAIYHTWFEEDRIMRKIVATTAGAAAGASATFSIAATSPSQSVTISQYNPPYPAGSTYTGGFTANINDVIQIAPATGANAGTLIKAVVKTVNPTAGTFTAVPLIAADSIPALATATEIPIIGTANPEVSSDPYPEAYRVNEYNNNMHKHRKLFEISQTAAGIQTWISSSDGKRYWQAAGEENTYIQFLNQRDLLCLLSEATDNANVSDITNATSTTNGVIPQVLASGYTQSYTLANGFTVANFQSMISGIELNKGAREYMGLMGGNLYRSIEVNLADFFKNGAITYGMFSGDQEKFVSLNFKQLSWSGYVFNFKNYELFNDYQTLASTGQPFRNEGLLIPMSGVNAGGEKSFSVELLYQRGQRMEQAVINPFQTTDDGKDVIKFRYKSAFMPVVRAAGQAAYILAS